MSQHSPSSNLEARLRSIGGKLGGSMRRELFGGALAILGLLLLIPVLRYSPADQAAPPLLVLLAGWTAPLVAIAAITAGVVLLLGPRAGYWSAEALVGAELFLLGLQVGTFVVGNESVNWNVRLDGSDWRFDWLGAGQPADGGSGPLADIPVGHSTGNRRRGSSAALYAAGLPAGGAEPVAARPVPLSGQIWPGA